MRKIFYFTFLVLAFSTAVFAQHTMTGKPEMNSKGEPVAKNKDNEPVDLKKGDKIMRGQALQKGASKIRIEKALMEPARLNGKTYEVKGVVVRSCKKEGCWMEIADKDGGKSVRVTFGDHAFFIPLNSAGMKVRAQGIFKTKILPKDHVDHLINDDGAKFENRNPDGTVTEVSFEATGVELVKK